MNIQEISRTASSTEVVSTYTVNKQNITLVSKFNNQVTLEELIYQIILRKLCTSQANQDRDIHLAENVV